MTGSAQKTSDFDFELPPERIAAHPVSPRDAARLLVVGDGFDDRHFRDLPELLAPGDLLVVNDTRVIPSRLTGRRGAARIEATLHKPESGDTWRAFARPAKRLHAGDQIEFADGLAATVVGKRDGGEVVLRFDRAGTELMAAIEAQGAMPLPPYLKRPEGPDPRDREDYQTIFADRAGAVAAPTAGLHFTADLLSALRARGVTRVTVTLHVGAGTFLPIKVEAVCDHVMHAEWGEISAAAAAAINETRQAGGRIVAVGSTSLRLIESAAAPDGTVNPFSQETDIFITPGYTFRVADVMLTNFHLPRSTLFMLVCAFAGTARMKAAYAHAISVGYRFYSYGDACLLRRESET